jgi:hypothetical protein
MRGHKSQRGSIRPRSLHRGLMARHEEVIVRLTSARSNSPVSETLFPFPQPEPWITRCVLIIGIFLATVCATRAQVTVAGNVTATTGQNQISVGNQIIDGNNYPCSDAGINAALAALPSTGGLVDATGCRGIEPISSTVTISANQEVRFARGAEWQPQSAGMTMFSLKAGGTLQGLWADISNQPGFRGQVLYFGDNYRDGTQTTADNILCTNGSVPSGTCIFMTASNLSAQSVAFVRVNGVHCYSYSVCVSLRTLGTGFINGNHFSDIHSSYAVFGYVFNATGGSISGNLFSNVSYQCCAPSGTSYGFYLEGTATIQQNIFSPAVVWDTTGSNLPIDNTTASANRNLFVGRFDGIITDTRDDYIDEQGGIAMFNSAKLRLGPGNSFGLGTDGLLFSVRPTISSGFGTSPSVLAGDGSGAFEVMVGSGGTATSGALNMPTAANGWACQVTDMSTNVVTRETAFTANSVTLTAASAWSAGDTLLVTCGGF